MYSKSIKNASGQVTSLVGQSNRKDIRNAVEASQKAQPGWAKRSGNRLFELVIKVATSLVDLLFTELMFFHSTS